MDVELFHDVCAVYHYGLYAEEQCVSDLFAGVSFGNELEHLFLTVGELFICRVTFPCRALHIAFYDCGRDRRVEERPALVDRSDRGDKLFARG